MYSFKVHFVTEKEDEHLKRAFIDVMLTESENNRGRHL